MKVFLDITPLTNTNRLRGVGIYTKYLKEYLAKSEKVELVDDLNEADIVHYPYFDPFFLTLTLKPEKKVIVTVHDLIPVVFPEHFPRGLRGEVKWQIQKRKLKQVNLVITDSTCSRDDIIKHAGVSKEKIQVIHLAPAPEFRILDKSNLDQAHKLPGSFLLYVGDVNWNKNIPGLLRAFACLTNFPDLHLVLVGQGFFDKSPETVRINSLVKDLNIEGRVIRLKDLSTAELVRVYNLATCYVQPSFYEGFGLPILEAMACGTPVVAGNTSSLPEICGEAAVMVNPDDANKIAEGIEKVVKDEDVQAKLVQAELKQVKKFTWKKTTEETIAIYQKVVRL